MLVNFYLSWFLVFLGFLVIWLFYIVDFIEFIKLIGVDFNNRLMWIIYYSSMLIDIFECLIIGLGVWKVVYFVRLNKI